jgi:predicted Co/Zn/Cd cation transporter (cation efflux family)
MILGYLGLGAFVGLLSHLVLQERGIKMIPSLGVAMAGGLIGGIISSTLNLMGSGFYALISSFIILFSFNVFRTDEEAVFESE